VKTTGIFTYGKFDIPFKKYREPIHLIPFGDVHRTAPLCHEQKWLEWLEWAKKLKNAWFIGMGDYDDFSSTSERDILNNRHLHNSTRQTLDDLYRKNVNNFAKEISFMKGKLIGLLEGNHYSELTSGITTTQLLCEKMDCKYLGVSAFIKLLFRKDIHHCHALDVWAHHGLGGGRTAGASINKIEQMIKAADADIYLMGHDHKKHIAMQSRLRLTDSRKSLSLENRKIVMARTGGFLKGYENNEPSYIADGAYAPVDMGTVTITITPQIQRVMLNKEVRSDTRWLDINASL
jgi:hypothetical protein